ncbi:unnamed protein product [Moneuplotes crassus]|uniref:Uncharacterized protein n=1 Tax=Euplotes crassus TaxID=5936 RepID=A0AAD1XM71_EUPCR|nr:unnamed protein product [Moneuplotes crassus]
MTQLGKLSFGNVISSGVMIPAAIFYAQNEAAVCDIPARDYIAAYFVIYFLMFLYRSIVLCLLMLTQKFNPLIFSLNLALFYTCGTVFFIFFMNDFFSDHNCRSVANNLWKSMICIVIDGFVWYILTLIQWFITGFFAMSNSKSLV